METAARVFQVEKKPIQKPDVEKGWGSLKNKSETQGLDHGEGEEVRWGWSLRVRLKLGHTQLGWSSWVLF